MTQSKFQIVDGQIIGPNLKIEAAVFVEPERQTDPTEGKKIILDAILDVANGAYREGRSSVLSSWDDRSLLRDAANALHALYLLLGSTMGDRHRRAGDVIARLLKQHEEET